MRRAWTRRQQRAHLKRIGKLGNKTIVAKFRAKKAAKAPVPPYAGTFLTFLDQVGRSGPTRQAWWIFWKAVDGLPLDPGELETFRLHTGRSTPPTTPARECWVIAGRRAGKSENVTAREVWRAISTDWSAVLSVGERGIIPLVAADKEQARNTLQYLKGLTKHPLVAPHVLRQLKDSVEFRTGATVKVMTASWRTTRGFTMLDAVLEECAFYSVEGSANPDEEILAAIRPALLTVPGARVHGISTPYSRRGILFSAWEKHWGKDESDVLVWVADTASMNPSVNQAEIQRAFEDDPAVAMAEYGRDGLVSFRSDVEALLSREAVQAVVVPGRLELPRVAGIAYVAFADPSGGSGSDSFALAIAHRDRDGVAILDCVREIKPRFSPDAATREMADTLKSYGVTKVVGDHWGGEWPREKFRQFGVTYEPSERVKSAVYTEVLPIINSGRCELLDLPRLKAQLVGLERRVARSGKDSIDHGPGSHDDVANAVGGALVLVAGGQARGKRVLLAADGIILFDSWAAPYQPPEEFDEDGN
ncbi:MAG: hypothetical protein DMD33_14100 [Gemmatimonadetes bacterium]|nr:MAG: hypothetical protein DMD33_14100 [Gemmatimonadota bacterium]